MSAESIDVSLDPTPVNPTAGPSTGSWSTHTTTGDSEGSFPSMDVDADLDRISCIESLCMNCHEQGMTRLLLTRIPYFRDIVVMSFECPFCHARSAEVQPANELALKASRVTLTVDAANVKETKQDLNRQVIKSETCRIEIPESEFEIPANNKRGDINTVEGVLSNIADSLTVEQANREIAEPEKAVKIQVVIDTFRAYATGTKSFTFILDDLAGNSFLENPSAPAVDPRVTNKYYERTNEQTLELGYAVEENKSEMESLKVLKGEDAAKKLKEVWDKGAGGKAAAAADAAHASASSSSSSSSSTKAQMPQLNEVTGRGVSVAPASLANLDTYFNVSDRSAIMQGPCSSCGKECETRMAVTDVPHFMDVVLLVTQCDSCGYRDAEVKPMGRVSSKGRKITLKVTCVDDLKRDLLKSDTASCAIPELELELQSGTLGGKYTTLEGMIEDIRSQLTKFNPFSLGDSSEDVNRSRMGTFIQNLTDLPLVLKPWTFILDDPLGNVFIFSPLGDADPNILIERYERTFEQNEELGLNDMNVDHYMNEEQEKELEEEIKGETAAAEVEAAMQLEMHGEKSADGVSRSQMAELQKGKIGGNISVDQDLELNTNNRTVGAATSSDPESFKQATAATTAAASTSSR